MKTIIIILLYLAIIFTALFLFTVLNFGMGLLIPNYTFIPQGKEMNYIIGTAIFALIFILIYVIVEY